MQNNPLHNNNFDFLRFLFASFVICTHTYALLGHIEHEPLFILSGRVFSEIGVCGFFVISGYLIHQSLERSSSLLSFARKRISRIFPGLIVAVLFSAMVIGSLATTLPLKAYLSHKATWLYILDNTFLIPRHLTLPGVFTHNPETAVNGSLWTLRYELLLYGLLALLFFLPRKAKKWILPLLFLLCVSGYLAARYGLFAALPAGLQPFLFYLGSLFHLSCYFSAGAALSLFTPILHKRKTVLLLVSVTLFFIALFSPQKEMAIIGHIISFPVMVITFGLHYTRILHFSKYTGDISYGTYIYAYPLQQALIVWLQPQNAAVLMIPSFLLSWLMGYLSWQLVEKRFLKKR